MCDFLKICDFWGVLGVCGGVWVYVIFSKFVIFREKSTSPLSFIYEL